MIYGEKMHILPLAIHSNKYNNEMEFQFLFHLIGERLLMVKLVTNANGGKYLRA